MASEESNSRYNRQMSGAARLRRKVGRWTGPAWVWGVLVGLALFCSVTIEDFGTLNNLMNIARQAVPLAIVTIGQAAVVITGGIDLSVAAMVSMGNTLSMGIMEGSGDRMWLTLSAPLVFGLVFGAINGLIVAKTAAPAFIATLGAGTVIQGIVFWYTDSATFGSPAPSFSKIGFESIGAVPVLVIVFLPVLLATILIQNKTRLGRHLYAVGDDDEVAERAGVNVTRVKLAAYMGSGVLAALAGLAVATRTGAGEPLAGTGFDWDSVAAVVIGGAVLTGGRGSIGGAIAGVLIIVMIDNAMTLQNVSSFWQSTVKGVIVLIAVIIAAVTAKDLAGRLSGFRPMDRFRGLTSGRDSDEVASVHKGGDAS